MVASMVKQSELAPERLDHVGTHGVLVGEVQPDLNRP